MASSYIQEDDAAAASFAPFPILYTTEEEEAEQALAIAMIESGFVHPQGASSIEVQDFGGFSQCQDVAKVPQYQDVAKIAQYQDIAEAPQHQEASGVPPYQEAEAAHQSDPISSFPPSPAHQPHQSVQVFCADEDQVVFHHCSKGNADPGSYDAFKVNMKPVKGNVCPRRYCGYSTARTFNMARHMREVHEDKNRFLVCCDVMTRKSGLMDLHQALRHGKSNGGGRSSSSSYPCPVQGCQEDFRLRSQLDKHAKTHRTLRKAGRKSMVKEVPCNKWDQVQMLGTLEYPKTGYMVSDEVMAKSDEVMAKSEEANGVDYEVVKSESAFSGLFDLDVPESVGVMNQTPETGTNWQQFLWHNEGFRVEI